MHHHLQYKASYPIVGYDLQSDVPIQANKTSIHTNVYCLISESDFKFSHALEA